MSPLYTSRISQLNLYSRVLTNGSKAEHILFRVQYRSIYDNALQYSWDGLFPLNIPLLHSWNTAFYALLLFLSCYDQFHLVSCFHHTKANKIYTPLPEHLSGVTGGFSIFRPGVHQLW